MTNEIATAPEAEYSVREWFESYQALALPVYRATTENGTDWIRMRLDTVFGAVSMPSKLAAQLSGPLPYAPMITNALTERTTVLVAAGPAPEEQTLRRLTNLGVSVSERTNTIVLPSTRDCPFQWVNRPTRGLHGMLFPVISEVVEILCPVLEVESHE